MHVVYSGTVAGAREGAMRCNAVGVSASLCSYSRSADYTEAGRLTADLVARISQSPSLTAALRGKVINVNVPHLSREDIKGVKLTQPGVSCTQADWVRVPEPEPASESNAPTVPASDAAFGDGIVELPIPLGGAMEDADWCKGKRWFRNKPGPARDDQREGYDKRAIDDGFVSVSVLGVDHASFPVQGKGATGGDMKQAMEAFSVAYGIHPA